LIGNGISAEELMMGAPSEVSPKQLRELDIRVVKPSSARPAGFFISKNCIF